MTPNTSEITHSAPALSKGAVDAAQEALTAGRISTSHADGDRVVASFVGHRWASMTSSGTSALSAALVGAGVSPGDIVVIPTVTCPAVLHAVRLVGADAHVVDVGTERPLLDPEMLDPAVVEGRVVIHPHMFGARVDLRALHEMGARVIEDSAQALEPRSSAYAQATVLSFSPTKLLTVGYAGAVATSSDVVAERIGRFLAPDDQTTWSDSELIPPIPFRLQAAVSAFQQEMLAVELARYPAIVTSRRRIVERYRTYLPGLEVLPVAVPFRHLVHLPEGFRARSVASEMRDRGVHAVALGSQLLHESFHLRGEFPNAEAWRDQLLSLPLHDDVDEKVVDRVATALMEVLS